MRLRISVCFNITSVILHYNRFIHTSNSSTIVPSSKFREKGIDNPGESYNHSFDNHSPSQIILTVASHSRQHALS
jgi:hypothetical protein